MEFEGLVENGRKNETLAGGCSVAYETTFCGLLFELGVKTVTCYNLYFGNQIFDGNLNILVSRN